MQLVLAVAVALLIIAVVAWPLLTRRRQPTRGSESADSPAAGTDHAAALNDVYDAIRTLQTDHSLGRVNDDDYREQLDEYRRQAAQLLRDMDRESGAERDA